MLETINDCINNGKQTEIMYKGHVRTVEIHALGVSRRGFEVMRVYQVSGGSSTGKTKGWKLIRVNEVTSLAALNDNATMPREGYKREDNHISEVYNQV